MGDLNGGFCTAYKKAEMQTFGVLMGREMGMTGEEADVYLDSLERGSASYGKFASGLNAQILSVNSILFLAIF